MFLVLRDPFSVIFSLVQPLVFLGLFGTLLAGSIDPACARRRVAAAVVPARGDRDDLPVRDRGRGIQPAVRDHPRQLRAGAGHPAAPVVDPDRQVAQGAGAAGGPGRAGHVVAIPFGFVLYPLHVLVGLLILGVFGVGMGAFSNALAVAVRKREWMFWAVQQSLLFPLLILSGMLLPLEPGRSGSRSSAGSTR